MTTVAPGANSLINVLYLGQPVVKDHSGDGVSESIISEIRKHGITPSQIDGASFDGQYFHLNVPKHLMTKSNISETFISTWDPLHEIGVIENHMRKDKDCVWLVDLTELCQDTYKKFNWGKNYQA